MYNKAMRKLYEQLCIDIMNNPDPLDLLLELTGTQQRIWKYIFDRRNTDNETVITQKQIAEETDHYPSDISNAIKALVNAEMVQRDKYSKIIINPYMWWFGEEPRKFRARDRWDRRRTENATSS